MVRYSHGVDVFFHQLFDKAVGCGVVVVCFSGHFELSSANDELGHDQFPLVYDA